MVLVVGPFKMEMTEKLITKCQVVKPLNLDIVHGLSYDFYGRRMATCSSDQWIRVWDLDQNNEWKKTSEWRAHDGSIWSVRWAHPEFGQILASCSFDRTVRIWEEIEGPDGNVKWMLKATLGDSVKQSVQDIQFAPKHLGLKLATCTRGGIVRIYEAIDITKLSHWTIVDQFQPQRDCINSICWNPSPFDAPMLAVAGEDKVITIYQYDTQAKQWQLECKLAGHDQPVYHVSWAPNLGRSYHMIASGSKDQTVRIWYLTAKDKEGGGTLMESKQVAAFDSHKSSVWSVEWNITGTILASSGDDGLVRFWKRNFSNDWKCLLEVRADGESSQSAKREYKF